MKKLISYLTSIAICANVLSGCYDSREIDDDIYAIAIGIDKGVENAIRLTVQYPTYKSNDGGGSSSANANMQSGSNVHTIECPTIIEGIDMLGMAISRRVSFMHVKMFVFSEDAAKRDLSQYITGLQRFRELRSSAALVVVKGTAEKFLQENKSNIGGTISKAVESMFLQAKYSNYFPYVHFRDFYINMVSPYQEPVAIYGGVNKFDNLKEENGASPPLVVHPGFDPGELPRKGVAKREFTGVAVFKAGKMVGSLDSYETTYFLMMQGQFPKGAVSFEDVNNPGKAIILNIRNNRKPVVKAKLTDESAAISIKLDLEADIQSIQSRFNMEDSKFQEELNKYVTEELEKGMKALVEKTQKEFKSDIFGFGKSVVSNFSTIQQFENYNWLQRYPQAEVNVEVVFNVRRNGFILKSSPLRKNYKSESGE